MLHHRSLSRSVRPSSSHHGHVGLQPGQQGLEATPDRSWLPLGARTSSWPRGSSGLESLAPQRPPCADLRAEATWGGEAAGGAPRACVRVVSQGALCKPGRPLPPRSPPPAPPRGLSPRVVTKVRPPPPGAIKHGPAARLPGSTRARTRRPGLHVAPAGRTPARDGVGVGACASGGAGRRQRRARLQGEQLPSQGELRQGSFLWVMVRHRQKGPRGSLFARQHHR